MSSVRAVLDSVGVVMVTLRGSGPTIGRCYRAEPRARQVLGRSVLVIIRSCPIGHKALLRPDRLCTSMRRRRAFWLRLRGSLGGSMVRLLPPSIESLKVGRRSISSGVCGALTRFATAVAIRGFSALAACALTPSRGADPLALSSAPPSNRRRWSSGALAPARRTNPCRSAWPRAWPAIVSRSGLRGPPDRTGPSDNPRAGSRA